jgi:hypothetical protein
MISLYIIVKNDILWGTDIRLLYCILCWIEIKPVDWNFFNGSELIPSDNNSNKWIETHSMESHMLEMKDRPSVLTIFEAITDISFDVVEKKHSG